MLIKVKNWIYSSLILFRQSVRQSLFLGMLYITIILFIPMLPVLEFFSPITIFLYPFIVLIYIHFYRELDAKRNFDIQHIFNLLKIKFRPLLFIGGLTFIFSTLLSMFFYADIGPKTEEIKSITEFSEKYQPTFIKLILISIPFIMATWFSPMLIFYNQYGAMKAIKSSLAGTLMFSIPLLLFIVIIFGTKFYFIFIKSFFASIFYCLYFNIVHIPVCHVQRYF